MKFTPEEAAAYRVAHGGTAHTDGCPLAANPSADPMLCRCNQAATA